MKQTIVVVGNGMVGQRFVECAVQQGLHQTHRIVVIGEEHRVAYDRVRLSAYFDGSTADDLALTSHNWFVDNGITLRLGCKVASIDRKRSVVTVTEETATGLVAHSDPLHFDHLVLATGSYPFVPPIPGVDAPGVFVYRTIEDLEAIEAYAANCARGTVVGGGLLGLEAANALRLLGLETAVVEFAPRLMPMQLDDGGAALLAARLEALGIAVHCSRSAVGIETDASSGRATGLQFADESIQAADIVVFSAGIRPRDEVARDAGLEMGERGGVVIDDQCQTSDTRIYAIGEVASHDGRVYGLVAPGYLMANVAACQIAGDTAMTFAGADTSTKLKLVGVGVASFGDAHGVAAGCESLVYSDPQQGTYSKIVVDATTGAAIGGVLVGDTSGFAVLTQMVAGVLPTPPLAASLIVPAMSTGTALTPASLPDAAGICSCHNVTKGSICAAIRDGAETVGEIKAATCAGTGCGSCVSVLTELLASEQRSMGRVVSSALCEHFEYSRQEIFDLIRIHEIASFRELIARHGQGRGCEICKPAVASMFASWNPGYVLDGEQASLQDTNDHVLANIQRDGTYSVVPRVPGGEITPTKLAAIAAVAEEFDLYTKITGAQRIDLFGARLDQLPDIWERLIAAGFESGHAYGKALRTVKSCVGSAWCRYGVQDAVGLAISIELRYRGLRAPHKLKSAVSGCARECAEAQSKDFGIIATERGYNLYVCGNGGMRPQHAVLFAEDLDETTLIQYLDRFLMFYIRTADRLERTAPWLNKRAGGVEELREILVDDSLGICGELERDMARHVERYECEWAATLADPVRLERFRPFVNTDENDVTLEYVRERGQRRPALRDEVLR